MRLPNYVKSKPKVGNFIPILGNATSQTLYPNIYLSKYAYDNLNSSNPSPKHIAHLIHEETHLRRQKEHGTHLWVLKYIFNPRFRFQEELSASVQQIRSLRKNNIPYDTELIAKKLSGSLYLWPVTYDYAKSEIDKALGKIKISSNIFTQPLLNI